MRKSIFFLFLLLIACTPASIATPTSTPIPPTLTVTLSPTETPEPTATPSGFQVSTNGAVRVFENGKWVDLNSPEGVWGPVGGIKIVLEKDGANENVFAQMILEGGFLDVDGDNLANVARYNKETKKWEVLDFMITRSLDELKTLSDKIYVLNRFPNLPLDIVAMQASLVGIKFNIDNNGFSTLRYLVLYKDKVFMIKPDMTVVNKTLNGDLRTSELEKNSFSVNQVVDLIDLANKNAASLNADVNFSLGWTIIPMGAKPEDCEDGSQLFGGRQSKSVIVWCKEELAKENTRTIPSLEVIQVKMLRGDNTIIVDKNAETVNMEELWDTVEVKDSIDGTFVSLWLSLSQ